MTRNAIALASTILFALGCAQPAPPTDESGARPEATSIANGSFNVEIDGRTIHYEIHGSGPVTIAVTNSWGLTIPGLRGMLGDLEERLTMVYFDPRGLGGSSSITDDADMSMAAVREDFAALRQHLGFDSVNAIGWSNGASNLIMLAAEQPDTIDAAVFVHGAATFGPEDMAAFAQQHSELTQMYVAFLQEAAEGTVPVEDTTKKMRTLWLDHYFPAITADRETAAPLISTAFAEAEFSWPHARYANQEGAGGMDLRDHLGSITARSLNIAGEHDSLPPERVAEISDGIANASFVVMKHSGHFAPLEEPERFTSEVFAFLGVADAVDQ